MSGNRFDQLTKAAASTTSRRQVLKLMGGGLVAALFGGGLFTSRARAAGNACLQPGSPCKVNGDCCETALGNSCCCRFSKKDLGEPGICGDRDACIEAGGVCHQ